MIEKLRLCQRFIHKKPSLPASSAAFRTGAQSRQILPNVRKLTKWKNSPIASLKKTRFAGLQASD
jgi:hypothetical protein